MRVLIADDNSIVRADLRHMLEEAGHTVCAETADGLAAVELAEQTRPDLAILDVRMPGLHGIEAARRIARERPIPVVILTGYGDHALTELTAAALVAGSYLAKPFAERELRLALEAAVAEHRRAAPGRFSLGAGLKRLRAVGRRGRRGLPPHP